MKQNFTDEITGISYTLQGDLVLSAVFFCIFVAIFIFVWYNICHEFEREWVYCNECKADKRQLRI